MTERDEEIARRAEHNMAEFMEKGPGLRWSTQTWVIAKDSTVRKVLVGGLGAMGVGRMWAESYDLHEENDPTFVDAPEVSWAVSTELCGGADRS